MTVTSCPLAAWLHLRVPFRVPSAQEDAIVGPFPDVVLYADSDKLTETEGLIDVHAHPNPDYDPEARPRKRRRRGPTLEHPSLDLYGGEEGLLVRTALIRSDKYRDRKPPVVQGAHDIARMCRHLTHSPNEYMVSISLNAANEVLAIHEAGVGPAGHVAFTVQQILKVAFLTSAVSMAMVHNHPSGDPRPSADDIRTTRAVAEGGGCLGISIIDHIIVARRGFYAFAHAIPRGDLLETPRDTRKFTPWPDES